MNEFSKRSNEKLSTCDARLQRLMIEVLQIIDISIICGHRNKEEQDNAYDNGFSKLEYPFSEHNKKPSTAVDVMLWNKEKPNIRWDDREQMIYVAGIIKGVAHKLGIKIRLGADWNGDAVFNESFFDAPHVELIDG